MEPCVSQRPILAHDHGVALALHRRAIERMMSGHDFALPSDVSVLDRHPQHQAFELATCRREIVEIILRQRSDVKTVLRLGLHEALLGKTHQTFSDHAGAAVVTDGEFGKSKLGARQHPARQDVGTQLRVHLLGTRDGRQRGTVTCSLWLCPLSSLHRTFPHGCIVKHFREWRAISKFS